MNIVQAVTKVANKFKYVSDMPYLLGVFDYWFIMREVKGLLHGDCEDFTLTSHYEYCDRNIFKFLWHLLITHKCQVHRVMTLNNQAHLVGCVDGLWFDNWTLDALPKEQFFATTRHRHQFRVVLPMMVFPLILGMFARYRSIE
jgi:hypothetical protein